MNPVKCLVINICTVSCLYLLNLPVVNAQQRLLFKVDVPVKYGITDKLQNIYVITPDDEVIKFDPKGKEMGRYTNNYMGDATLIDPTNPINTIVYYPDLQTFVTLDVTVNEISRTNLVSFGFFNIQTICSTNDGNLWMMDGMEFRLKKIDRTGKILASSENLMLTLGRAPEIVQLLERDNKVYALEKNLGVYVFDNFGNFDRKFDIPNINYFQIFSDKLFYFRDGNVMFFDTELLSQSFVNLPREDLDNILFFNIHIDKIYLFEENGFEVWQY